MSIDSGPEEFTEQKRRIKNRNAEGDVSPALREHISLAARKIFADQTIGISPTTVRVPVITGHSESVHVQFHRPMLVAEARTLLASAPGVKLSEGPYAPGKHPQPIDCVGTDHVFVGRLRNDLAIPGAINMWIVADNLRKGAALNAVQIAEQLL